MSGDLAETDRVGGPEIFRSAGDSLLDQIDIPLYAVDAAGRCIRINVAGERLLGYSQGEALGEDMHRLVHYKWPDGRPYAAEECALLQARSAQRTIHQIEEVLWTKTGAPVPVECSASPATMADGTVGAIVTLKDLRGKVHAEQRMQAVLREQQETMRQAGDLAAEAAERQRVVHAALEQAAADKIREQQELLGTVAETSPVGIAVFDDQAHYRWTNESYVQGMDPAFVRVELKGTSFFSTVPAGNLKELRTIVAGVQATGQTFMAEAYPLSGGGAWDDVLAVVVEPAGKRRSDVDGRQRHGRGECTAGGGVGVCERADPAVSAGRSDDGVCARECAVCGVVWRDTGRDAGATDGQFFKLRRG